MSVDGGGVEFALELNARLDEATKMIRELTKVQAAALQAGKGLHEAEKKAGLFGRAIHHAGEQVKDFARETMAHFTALASIEGLKLLGEGLWDLGKEALNAAGEAERTRESFRLLMGVPVADDLLEYLDELAKHTEFTDGALKQFAGELSSAGLSGMSLKKGLGAVIDIAALTGNKVEGAANAVALLSKMTLKGEVSTRELLGAKIDPKAFFAQVAKDAGIGVKLVEKAIQDNKISGTVLRGALFETIQKKTGKDLGGAGVAMSKGFLAQKEKMGDIVPNLMEELEKSGGLKGITLGMSKLVAAFDPNSPSGQAMVKGMTEVFDKIGASVAKIDFEKLAKTLTDLFTNLPGLIGKTIDAIGPLASIISGIVKGIAAIGTFLGETSAAGYLNATGASTPSRGFDYADRVKQAMAAKAGGAVKAAQTAVPPAVQSTFNMMDAVGAPGGGVLLTPPTASGQSATPSTPSTVSPVRPGSGAGASLIMPKPNQSFAANVTVHVNGVGGDEANRSELGDQVGASARRHMESLFERMAAEGGAT